MRYCTKKRGSEILQQKSGTHRDASPQIESQPVSRVLSRIIIHLDRKSPPDLKQPTRKRRGPRHRFPIWSCSGWGLPCRFCYQKRGALLPHHFTLTSRGWRYTFCCTGRGLAPPRRYLAPCPVEPGLSSSPEALASPEPAIIQLTGGDYTRSRGKGSIVFAAPRKTATALRLPTGPGETRAGAAA